MNLERVLDPTSPPTAPVWRPLQLSPTDGNGAVAPITLPVGCGIVSQATVTRPANTTAYTAGDVIGGVITFAGMGRAGGETTIQVADLMVNIAAVPAGMASMRLHLYGVTPPSALADNAPWDLPSGDRAGYLGYVDFGTPVDLGSTLYVQAVSAAGQIVPLAAADTNVYAYLQTIGGFTPAANSEVYQPRLRGFML